MQLEKHSSPISKELLEEVRPFMATCWQDTYSDSLGHEVVANLVDNLGDGTLGGGLPGIGETLLLVRDGDTIVATCTYAYGDECGAVWGLYITRPYQRKGIGSQLLRVAAEAGKPDDTIQLFVMQDATDAINFYLRNQFVIANQIRGEILPGVATSCLLLSASVAALLATIPCDTALHPVASAGPCSVL
ncbi:GNAT family N-acetyltransferase [Martelella sp. HB161492]|uniref:GNAT family N-acetyltransferase n=1 Tax=Martelella sp. HB161492 TaxID=2720726 RepID=UPI0015925E6E|nr:GNAT family N-acetyltransferase [Martelella sp. HB161492]